MNRESFIAFTLLVSVFFCSSFTPLYAVADQFNVNLTVTNTADVVAPSIPVNVLATAVSQSQINVSWDASTDNVAVTGYRIYRDNAFVTSVAGTSYSDIGLTSATTYSYTVSAIDAALNESAQSATSSATTLSPSAPSSGGGGGGSGQFIVPIIYDFTVLNEGNQIVVSWKTVIPTIGTLSWGQTADVSDGTMNEIVYATEHRVTLENLLFGTLYRGTLRAQSGYGARSQVVPFSFSTYALPEGEANPTNLRATANTKSILLEWNNPPRDRFSEVRLVRSESFYPADPSDGETIFEGSQQSFEDTNVQIGIRYFYTLFAKGNDGKYSSGIVTDARVKIPGELDVLIDVIDTLPDALNVHPDIAALQFTDFDFIQVGKKINTLGSETVSIDGTKNLTISLDYKKVPEVLKSILITLEHPENASSTFSFLLRVNDDKTAYTATIAPLGDSGKYGVRIAIVDYKNQGLKKIAGNLFAGVLSGLTNDRSTFGSSREVLQLSLLALLLLIIFLLSTTKVFKIVFGKKKKEVPVSLTQK